MKEAFRFVIPTRDSARWIGHFLNAYRSLGVEPFYVCDTRSVDDTSGLLRSLGADVIEFTPSEDFAEAGMIEFAARQAGTKWMFRLDDDEFPSKKLVAWTSEFATRRNSQAIFFSRREVFKLDNDWVYSRAPGRYGRTDRPTYLHPHPRLTQSGELDYIERVHTPGFREPAFVSFAPEDAFFIHCNCLVRTPAERLEKIRRYERIGPGTTWPLADEYLPELFDGDWHRASSEGLDEFQALFENLPRLDEGQPLDLSPLEREAMQRGISHLNDQNAEGRKRSAAQLATQIERYGSVEFEEGVPSYTTTLSDGIKFGRFGQPSIIKSMKGVSAIEDWGRWTEGPKFELAFAAPLPKMFAVELTGHAYGPNHERGIVLRAGTFATEFKMSSTVTQTCRIVVSNRTAADRLQLAIPAPTSPAMLGLSNDTRQLGIALIKLTIQPLTPKEKANHIWQQFVMMAHTLRAFVMNKGRGASKPQHMTGP